MASVIESNLTIDGNLTCQGDLMINGRVHGDVIAQNLTISEFGSLQGNIQAGKVDSNGTIAGTITAKEVALGGTSSTHATIKAEKSNIKDGALINGDLKIGPVLKSEIPVMLHLYRLNNNPCRQGFDGPVWTIFPLRHIIFFIQCWAISCSGLYDQKNTYQ